MRIISLLTLALALAVIVSGCQKQSEERNDMPIKTTTAKGKSKMLEASLEDAPKK